MGVRVCRGAVAVVAALLALSACSHGVPPETWAKKVCTALKPWTATIRDLTSRTQRQMEHVTTPDQAKVTLVGLLDQEARASGRARDRLLAAGVPDVDDGKRIADRFGAALDSARRSYATARDTIRKLPTTDAKAFYRGVTVAMDRLNSQYRAGSLDTSSISSPELQRAFDDVPQCQ